MMSNKWAFSLTVLITIFAMVFAVTPAMAGDFAVTVTQRGSAMYTLSAGVLSTDVINIDLDIEFAQPVGDIVDATTPIIALTYFNKLGATVTPATVTLTDRPIAEYPMRTAKKRQVRIALTPEAAGTAAPDNALGLVTKIVVKIPKIQTIDPTIKADDNMSEEKFHTINMVQPVASNPDRPMVVSITRLGDRSQPGVSSFIEEKVTGAFDVKIVFTEKPHDFKLSHIKVEGGTASNLVVGKAFSPVGSVEPWARATSLMPHPFEGDYDHNITGLRGAGTGTDNVPSTTGPDGMYHQYRVTITPHRRVNMVKVSINEFHDNASPFPNVYKPFDIGNKPNGREQLRLDVAESLAALGAGFMFYLPHSEGAQITYANSTAGHYILTKNKDGSGIKYFHEKDEENVAHKQTPAQLLYNVRASGSLPNLETFLANNGTIDLVAYDGTAAGAAYISEVMWGTDASKGDATESQWIEIANGTSAAIGIGENKWALWFYQANEAPRASYVKDDGTAGVLVDRIGTRTGGAGAGWPIAGKGQSGRTGITEGDDTTAAIPIQKLISMYRVMDATGAPADGTMESSWMASAPPSVNFKLGLEGRYDATPGASIVTLPVPPPPPPAAAAAVPVAMASDIMITEIMVDTGNNRLPQWIELTNVSGAEKSLAGWSVQIMNSGDDAGAVGSSVSIDLSGTLGVGGGADMGGTMGKALLLVAWGGRKSSNLEGNERIVDVSSEVGQRGRYKLISDMAFMIALIPPQTTGVLAYGDTAGNLGADPAWDLPMSENGRSSLIRKIDAGVSMMGDAAASWVLASGTGLIQTAATWYGSDEDAGTPGVVGGGPLPVELSHFRPARDKATGAVVITWATQSELNNAGFFIKRSNQRDGEFKVINATMVPGAGTSSEKQFYTYTDTTAQPNVVYYYQIEDVSLDGNRQTLTRGIRLKGHVGAAGKATVIWGELKTSHE